MDNSTDGLNILSMAVQEHSKHSSCAELKSKTPAGYIVKVHLRDKFIVVINGSLCILFILLSVAPVSYSYSR